MGLRITGGRLPKEFRLKIVGRRLKCEAARPGAPFGTNLAPPRSMTHTRSRSKMMSMFDQLLTRARPDCGAARGLVLPRHARGRRRRRPDARFAARERVQAGERLAGPGHPRPSRSGGDPDGLVQGRRRRRAAGLVRHRPFPRTSDVQGHRPHANRLVLQDHRQEWRRGQRLHQSRRDRLFPARGQGSPAQGDGDGGRPHGQSPPLSRTTSTPSARSSSKSAAPASTTIRAASCRSR